MAYFNPTLPITIGNDTSIGGHSQLFTHSSWLSELEGYPVKFAPIKIGNFVWGSWRTFITAGVEIGDYVILHPNSVVSKNVPSNSIYSSNPTKIIPNFIHTEKTFEEKKQIINDIVRDFKKYLIYNNINVTNSNNCISCTVDNCNYKIFIYNEAGIKLTSNNSDFNVFISLLKFIPTVNQIGSNDMLLSIEDKKRYGSNMLGEELITFLSRYGIRFNRI